VEDVFGEIRERGRDIKRINTREIIVKHMFMI